MVRDRRRGLDMDDGHEHLSGQGRLLDDDGTPLAVPDRPDVKVAAGATDTSRQAAYLALPRSGTQRMRVLSCVWAWTLRQGRGGITDAELEDELDLSGNSVRPRRLELVEQGWVEDSGERRAHGRSGPGVVWRLTEAGQRAYEQQP